jgi:hypothetical protein
MTDLHSLGYYSFLDDAPLSRSSRCGRDLHGQKTLIKQQLPLFGDASLMDLYLYTRNLHLKIEQLETITMVLSAAVIYLLLTRKS